MATTTYETFTGTGETLPEEMDTSNHLPLKPRQVSPAFTLCHIPTRWTWSKDYGWLPELSRITHRPGCNGVEAHGSGPTARINPLPAIAGAQAIKGATVFDRKDPRLPGGDYLRRHMTKTGQYHYTTKYESWVRVGRGKLRKKFDDAGYNAWLRELEAAGYIEPMPIEILEDKLDIIDKKIDRYRQDPRIGMAAIEVGLKGAEEQRAKMISDWEDRYGEKPESKKGKK